ncbi:inositol monophosphatase family protein [Halalkalirubrum salinum]|uniref:inositol monophosphatase family protein n=1 Tax=Halalkalirubrum salinum TaxID=2563889 RepID=UPI0010FB1AC8|nr:inositol monophosphatase [Halalkalirubrum salinum]
MSDRAPTASSIDEFVAVAESAARAGGDYVRSVFRSRAVDGEFNGTDVKTRTDREAESRVLNSITDRFPNHAIHAEESGKRGDSTYQWVIDPLDGTNNFASGIPMVATAVALLAEGEPIVAAIYAPLTDVMYVARRGEGATLNGEPLTAQSDLPLAHGTVSFVVGLDAVRDPAVAPIVRGIKDAIEPACKRVLQTWAPCLDWGLVSGGSIEGIVCYRPDVYEHYAGSLLARESGVHTTETEDIFVGAAEQAVHDQLLAHVHNATKP